MYKRYACAYLFTLNSRLYIHNSNFIFRPCLPYPILFSGYKIDHSTKQGIKVYTSINDRYQVGIIEVTIPNGHIVCCYDP